MDSRTAVWNCARGIKKRNEYSWCCTVHIHRFSENLAGDPGLRNNCDPKTRLHCPVSLHASMCDVLVSTAPSVFLLSLSLSPSLRPITPITFAVSTTSIAFILLFLLRCLGLEPTQFPRTCPVGKSAVSSVARCGGVTVIKTSRLTGTGYGIGIALTGNRLGRGRGRISSMQRMANLLL